MYRFNICWYAAKHWGSGLLNIIAWIYWEHSTLAAQKYPLQSGSNKNV